MRSVSPSRAPSNWRVTPWPTISSRRPGSKPAALDDLQLRPQGEGGRLDAAHGDVGAGLLAGLHQFGDHDNSAEASGLPSAPWAMPGACLMSVP